MFDSSLPVLVEVRETGEGKCGAKGQLECDIVLHRRAQIYVGKVTLHALVRDEVNALRLGSLDCSVSHEK